MGDEEGSGSSSVGVASSCPSALINWWDVHATTSLSCWTNHSHSSSCDDAISVSNSTSSFSNHHHHTHLWTHVLLNEDLQNTNTSQQVGENDFVDALSSKSMASSMMFVEPACDYLKKMDTTSTASWDYSNSNSFDKHFNGDFSEECEEAMLEPQRLSKLSNLVSTWSIAPPHPQVDHNSHFIPHTNINIPTTNLNNSSMDHNSGIFPSYGTLDHMKVKQEHRHLLLQDASEQVPAGSALFGRSSCNSNNNNSTTINGFINSLAAAGSVGDNNINGKFYHAADLSSSTRNLSDVISFAGRLGRPVIGIHALKPTLKSSGLRTSNGRGQGSSTEVKKKRTEESSEAMLKKPKQDTCTASSTKVQAPKVKLGDRITTLQQIVSPFGKTDTASVLFEAIGCIKFLQEQIQLLSNSYTKTNSHKDAWGSMERKEKGEVKVDLRSRGLCLVPISCTPQLYRDTTTAPDYWTPAYRGCLYR